MASAERRYEYEYCTTIQYSMFFPCQKRNKSYVKVSFSRDRPSSGRTVLRVCVSCKRTRGRAYDGHEAWSDVLETQNDSFTALGARSQARGYGTDRKRHCSLQCRGTDRKRRSSMKRENTLGLGRAPFFVSSSMLAKVSCMFLAVFISSLRISSSAMRLAAASASACPPAEVQPARRGWERSERATRERNNASEKKSEIHADGEKPRQTKRKKKRGGEGEGVCAVVSGRGPTNTAACVSPSAMIER